VYMLSTRVETSVDRLPPPRLENRKYGRKRTFAERAAIRGLQPLVNELSNGDRWCCVTVERFPNVCYLSLIHNLR